MAATLLLVALIAAACSGDEADGAPAEIRDLMTIVDGDIAVEQHGDGTATVSVDTTIDLVCAVSYGRTAALGAIATDTDMGGGGHSDHHALLVGLEANTEYFYVLNGIGPDGTLYSTDVRTFTTGAFTTGVPGENIAAGATVVDVSSEFSSGFAAANALDGDRSTEWSSAGDGDDAYIVIDLGATAEIGGVGFRTREMTDGTSITTSFTVTVDGGEPFGPFEAGPGLATADFAATGSQLRIDVETSTGGNTGAIEIEVYGAFIE